MVIKKSNSASGKKKKKQGISQRPVFLINNGFIETHLTCIWLTHLQCILQLFSVYLQSCAADPQLTLQYFHQSQRNPRPSSYPLSFPYSVPPSLDNPLIYFPSLWICLLWTFHLNRIIRYMISCDWFLSHRVVFSRFTPPCSMSVSYFLLLPNNISLYRYTSFF